MVLGKWRNATVAMIPGIACIMLVGLYVLRYADQNVSVTAEEPSNAPQERWPIYFRESTHLPFRGDW